MDVMDVGLSYCFGIVGLVIGLVVGKCNLLVFGGGGWEEVAWGFVCGVVG